MIALYTAASLSWFGVQSSRYDDTLSTFPLRRCAFFCLPAYDHAPSSPTGFDSQMAHAFCLLPGSIPRRRTLSAISVAAKPAATTMTATSLSWFGVQCCRCDAAPFPTTTLRLLLLTRPRPRAFYPVRFPDGGAVCYRG
jgi:hypothetical protein